MPLRISSEIGSSIYFCTALLSGLAPNNGSYPFVDRNSFALSVNSNVIPSARILFSSCLVEISIIWNISSFVSCLNVIRSSILFRNSGLNTFLNRFFYVRSSSYHAYPDYRSFRNPIEPIDLISFVPIFDVIISIVFLKSTLLPRLSVNMPSSST